VGRLASIRQSAAPYLSILAIGIVVARFGDYLWPGEPFFKGQGPLILVFYFFFALSLVLWLPLKGRPPAGGWLLAFLIAMSIAWVAHLGLARLHGDAFNYTALLYVPILAMIAIKPPRADEAWRAVLAFAWTTAAVLVLTRGLEMADIIEIKSQPVNIIAFDEARYWLPLNDWLGIDGRWPGPFGHNADTAMLGALLVVIGVARWSRASWVFLPVGVLTLMLTAGRASQGAVAAGIVVIAMFTRSGFLTRIPRWLRVSGGGVLLVLGLFVMYSAKAGLTGRERIWPAFFELWQTSPITGVGGSGIAVSGGVTQEFGHAHSLYLDELARNGLIGFVTQFAALGVGLVIAAWAAGRGAPGPLAVLVAYFVTGVTEPRNDWIHPTVTGFLVTLMVVTAAAELQRLDALRAAVEQRPSRPSPRLELPRQ
jgi:hypothetical protein